VVVKVVTVVGARPQFVKAAALGAALRRAGVQEVLVHTGQHHDAELSQVFFDELEMAPPAYSLDIHGGGHGAMTGRMLEALEPLLLKESPDAVVLFGDTNSTLAGALAAAKLHLPVVHVEAGLRSFNRAMPEEVNRVLTDHLSALLLAPTTTAVAHLAAEGITAGVHHVGDVMYDLSLQAAARARAGSTVLERHDLVPGSYAAATVHRAENTDDPIRLAAVIDFLRAWQVPVVLPLHPRTRAAADRAGLSLDGLVVLPPLSYLDMVRLVTGATAVLTDSGGLQKEAYFHGVPCVTLRDETEWVETIDAGWNRLWSVPDYRARRTIEEYGDGHAADVCARLISELTAPPT
jgi:UDP-GlcNAc3NAcA epimerase